MPYMALHPRSLEMHLKTGRTSKGGSRMSEPSSFKLEATVEEQLDYFSEVKRKAAVPRELEVHDPSAPLEQEQVPHESE